MIQLLAVVSRQHQRGELINLELATDYGWNSMEYIPSFFISALSAIEGGRAIIVQRTILRHHTCYSSFTAALVEVMWNLILEENSPAEVAGHLFLTLLNTFHCA